MCSGSGDSAKEPESANDSHNDSTWKSKKIIIKIIVMIMNAF